MHECARGGMDDDDDDVDDDVDETHRADDETYFHPSRRRVVSPSRASRRRPSLQLILLRVPKRRPPRPQNKLWRGVRTKCFFSQV